MSSCIKKQPNEKSWNLHQYQEVLSQAFSTQLSQMVQVRRNIHTLATTNHFHLPTQSCKATRNVRRFPVSYAVLLLRTQQRNAALKRLGRCFLGSMATPKGLFEMSKATCQLSDPNCKKYTQNSEFCWNRKHIAYSEHEFFQFLIPSFQASIHEYPLPNSC